MKQEKTGKRKLKKGFRMIGRILLIAVAAIAVTVFALSEVLPTLRFALKTGLPGLVIPQTSACRTYGLNTVSTAQGCAGPDTD